LEGDNLSVDIDIGGARFEDLGEEEEDVVPVDAEEVEVLEEEPIEPPTRPLKAPPSTIKKPSRWVKPLLVVVVVIVLIIVALFAILLIGTKVSDINVALDKNDPDNLEVTVLVSTTGMAGIAGEGDLKIEYQDDIIYNTKVNINDEGNGYKSIPYNNFVEGNGNYYVSVEYKGKESPSAEYEVEYIVESLNISVEVGKVASGGQLNLTVYMLDEDGNIMGDDPEDVKVTVEEIVSLDDGTTIAENESPITTSERSHKIEFPYSRAGTYTITVSLENTRINPDSGSDYYKISATRNAFLNILPIAAANYEIHDNITTWWVEFNAGISWNDGDNTRYIWDFDGDGTIDDETEYPTTSHNYIKIGTSQVDVNLNVVGDIIDPVTGELERGARTITITF
jgi:hypothetical protein